MSYKSGRSLDFTVNRVLMTLFRTADIDMIKDCIVMYLVLNYPLYG